MLNDTPASQDLHIARQSLRQDIASMETELSQPLFVNTHNKLSLTKYGAYDVIDVAERGHRLRLCHPNALQARAFHHARAFIDAEYKTRWMRHQRE